MTIPNVSSAANARFIFESVEAAKDLLSTVNNYAHMYDLMRFMPTKVYLYVIYSGVFLWQARSFGVISPGEQTEILHIVNVAIACLEQISPAVDSLSNIYAQRLRILWRSQDETANSMQADRNAMNANQAPHSDEMPFEMGTSPNENFEWQLFGRPVGDILVEDPIYQEQNMEYVQGAPYLYDLNLPF